jgi:hypothetical protein
MAKPDRLATLAMAMMQTLHLATGGRLEWRAVTLVVSQHEHFETLEYAAATTALLLQRLLALRPGDLLEI